MTIYQPLNLTPKFIPMICPVCRGHKTVNWGKQPCEVCNAKGYLEVPPKEGEDYARSNHR